MKYVSRLSKEQYESIRSQVSKYMYDNGISLPTMAKHIGISQLSLRHFLTGKTEPYWITIGKIEKVLGKLDVSQSI